MADATTAQPNDFGSWLTANLPALVTGGFDIASLIKGTDKSNAAAAIQIADPLLPAQGQALKQLQSFLTDPSSVLKDPAFTSAEQLGAENVARYTGAQGFGGSGNQMADLFRFGQTAGLNYEQQKFNQLMSVLKGSPDAADILTQGQKNQQNTWADLLKSLFGAPGGSAAGGLLGGLIKGLFGGGGGTGDLTFDDSGTVGFGTPYDPSSPTFVGPPDMGFGNLGNLGDMTGFLGGLQDVTGW